MSEWFKWFPWLYYSHSEDAIYCLSYVIFGYCFLRRDQEPKNFIPKLLNIGQQKSRHIKYLLKERKKDVSN